MTTISNYGRTWSFSPAKVAYPTSAAELAAVVRGARRVRVMGSRHSWSKGIVTDDTLVSLDRMSRVLAIDRSALRVTAQAGIKLCDLIVQLEAHGLALGNLGSISEQSLAGAISTGTHGTGLGFPCLAAHVESFKVIDGRGEERCVRETDAAFAASIVGLGCLGIIHEMTLRVVPSFQMHAVTGTARFDDVIANLEGYVGGFDHFKFWWFVPDENLIVFKNDRTSRPRNDSTVKRWVRDDVLSVMIYRSLVALGKLDRKRLVPGMNRFLTREGGRHFDCICKSHVAFQTPVPPVHRETEWAFDYAGAKELLADYRELLLSSGHTYNFIQEVRFTKGDDFWLSPAYRRDSIWLSMYNMDTDARWSDQLRQFEAFARTHGGRPHWGKEATLDADYLRSQWPEMARFSDLRREHDPEGRFVNAWAEQVFGR
jgi:FAD/FMN-containing dehydrogenase